MERNVARQISMVYIGSLTQLKDSICRWIPEVIRTKCRYPKMPESRNEPAGPPGQPTQISDVSTVLQVPTAALTRVRPHSGRKQKKLSTVVKSWSWRMTASYLWLTFLARFFSGHDVANELETHWNSALASFLSSIGFAPANPHDLEEVLKVGWVLTITAFKPVEFLGCCFIPCLLRSLWFFGFGGETYIRLGPRLLIRRSVDSGRLRLAAPRFLF